MGIATSRPASDSFSSCERGNTFLVCQQFPWPKPRHLHFQLLLLILWLIRQVVISSQCVVLVLVHSACNSKCPKWLMWASLAGEGDSMTAIVTLG